MLSVSLVSRYEPNAHCSLCLRVVSNIFKVTRGNCRPKLQLRCSPRLGLERCFHAFHLLCRNETALLQHGTLLFVLLQALCEHNVRIGSLHLIRFRAQPPVHVANHTLRRWLSVSFGVHFLMNRAFETRESVVLLPDASILQVLLLGAASGHKQRCCHQKDAKLHFHGPRSPPRKPHQQVLASRSSKLKAVSDLVLLPFSSEKSSRSCHGMEQGRRSQVDRERTQARC